ncbi:MAG: anaerobic ribonucleoside-triphosphate reductase activating protein [Sphaerochaetaceae bacterium]|nr:anaerobic ribonucleoside-triphosphate reductase activating protein [Sphaerochaetaceae bacterium]
MNFSGFQKSDLLNFPGKVASTVFTYGCNFRCPYCHNYGFVVGGQQESYPEVLILNYLEKRKDMLEAVAISGGEPTLYDKELPPFMRKVKEMGLLVKMDTNGSRPEVLKAMLDEKLLDYVAMDIKTSLDKYSMFGYSEVENIEKSIEILKNSGIDFEFRTTCPKSIVSEDDLVEINKLVGSSKWYLQMFNPRYTLDEAFHEESSYSEEELQELIKKHSLNVTGIR